MIYYLFAQSGNDGIFEVLVHAASQVPALAVLCVIVYVFLTHIKASQAEQTARDNAYEARMSKRDEHLSSLSDTCHEFQRAFAADSKEFHKELARSSQEALQECKAVIKDNTVALVGIKTELAKKG